MKTLKPIMFVAAGMAIALLFAFKNEEPKKEYSMMRVWGGNKVEILITYSGDSKEYRLDKKAEELDKEAVKIINDLLAAGWKLISTDIVPDAHGANTAMMGSHLKYYHFERNKQ
jgi:hypothetical protein